MAETKLGDGQPKPPGTWDYYGELDPKHGQTKGHLTFSVGVFQWVPKGSRKGSRKGTKRSPAIKRFAGSVNEPEAVYEKAIAFIREQEQG